MCVRLREVSCNHHCLKTRVQLEDGESLCFTINKPRCVRSSSSHDPVKQEAVITPDVSRPSSPSSFLPPCSLSFFLSCSLGLSNDAQTSGFSSVSDQHSGRFRAWKVSLVEDFLKLDSLEHIGHCPVAVEAVRNATHKHTYINETMHGSAELLIIDFRCALVGRCEQCCPIHTLKPW